MAQNLIDLVNFGGGVVSALAPTVLTQNLSGSFNTQGPQIDAMNLNDPINLVVTVGSSTTSGISWQLEETFASGGTSGWTAIVGTQYPATSGSTTGGVAASGQVFVTRGYRNYEFVRFNPSYSTSGAVGLSGSQTTLSALVIQQGKFTATGSVVVGVAASSGSTAAFGTGTSRWPST